MLLEEFDPERSAIINPEECYVPLPDFPETAVAGLSGELVLFLGSAVGVG